MVLMQRHHAGAAQDLPAPGLREGLHRFRFDALGTRCEVQYASGQSAPEVEYEREAVAWVAAFEAKYSRFRPDSLISRINAAAGGDWVEIDAEAAALLDLCEGLYLYTRGILDPTTLPLMRLWDYRASKPTIPSAEAVQAALGRVGWAKVRREPGRIRLDEGMSLDLGGFGKEYAVDRVAEMAAGFGIGAVLVDFGHDIRAVGRPPGAPFWHVGLENPRSPGTCWSGLGVSDRGVASSGDYLRRFISGGQRYGHIIDPRTGRPVAHGDLAATVVASSCLEAGVLATTAFVLGAREGLAFIAEISGVEACVVGEEKLHQTGGFYAYVVSH